MLTFVHAADLHLDSPLRGLERYEGAPADAMRAATRRALENLVDLCLEEEASLLLLAGDLYDGDWRDYATGMFFARQMSRLREGDVRVVMVRGNHDAQSVVTKHVPLPENVTELRAREPESLVLEDLGIAVHGQSYAKPAVEDDLAAGYPSRLSGMLNVGLLHTCATGRPGHAPYAPTTVETLLDRGYDYWALGHVHRREVLHEAPWIVFPGNLQGRHARETGDKGATVVRVVDGVISRVEHRALDAARWAHLELDVADASDAHDVVARAKAALEEAMVEAEGRPLASRLTLTGATRAHGALTEQREKWVQHLRTEANDLPTVWLERIRWQTRPLVDAAGLEEREDAIGQVVRRVRSIATDEEALADLAAELRELQTKLPPELKHGEDALLLDQPELVAELLGDVEGLLLERLLRSDE